LVLAVRADLLASRVMTALSATGFRPSLIPSGDHNQPSQGFPQ